MIKILRFILEELKIMTISMLLNISNEESRVVQNYVQLYTTLVQSTVYVDKVLTCGIVC